MKNFCAHCQGLRWTPPAYFLPDAVVPANLPGAEPEYRIVLEPTVEGENPNFKGAVAITVDVIRPVMEFPINSVDLELNYVSVIDSAGVQRIAKLRHNKEAQEVWLCFDEALAVGRALISIEYQGLFNPKLKGFYLSKHTDDEGVTTTVGCTQSEPADFRRWVPSFDQPGPKAYKCKFSIKALIPADQVARSNGDVISEEILPSGKKLVSFATTNPLPTYVIALAAGYLESSDPIVVSGVEIRVWAPPGNKHLMGFALEVARRGLPALEKFHGQKYPNRKLDLIAIDGFSAGAMENDGMFTFRMEYVLIDRAAATIKQLLQLTITILHEMDHTWDGNRHTMVDWSQLSLNELRATFMSYLIADRLFPEFKVWDDFAQGRAQAMDVDSLKNTRSVVSPVERLDQCESMFDKITYLKGSAVLRVMQTCLDALVKDGFERGMQSFNNDSRYDWGNATTGELWEAIGEATGFDVLGFMEGWTKQPGFPTISVKRASNSAIVVRQSRFTYTSGEPESDQLWQVPLFVRAFTRDGRIIETLLHLDEREQTFDLGSDFDWVFVNVGAHGFFHSSYEDELFTQISEHAQSDLTGVERFVLLNDAWAALQTGQLKVTLYLQLLWKFQNDRDPNVWRIISTSLSQLGSFGTEVSKALISSLAEQLTKPLYTELGWKRNEGETPQITELRGIILGVLGRQKLDWFSWIAWLDAYLPWVNGSKDIDPDVLAAACGALATAGDAADYEDLVKLLNPQVKELTPQQTVMLLGALTRFADPDLGSKTFLKVLSGEIDLQMSGMVIQGLLANAQVRHAVWALIKENFAALSEKLPIGLLIRGLGGIGYLDQPSDEADVRDFLALQAEKLRGNEVPVAQSLERQRTNIAFRARCEAELQLIVRGMFNGLGYPH